MRLHYLLLIPLLLLNIGLDVYLTRLCNKPGNKTWRNIQIVTAAILTAAVAVVMCFPLRNTGNAGVLAMMWLLWTYITVYAAKWTFAIVRLTGKIPQLWHRQFFRPSNYIAAGVAVAVFVLMWWGALINRFNTQVCYADVEIENLPDGLEGLRIVQISDLHTGTYSHDTSFVHKLVAEINAQKPDLIVFTGDIVNRSSVEVEPFVRPLSVLKARYGVYSVLGNHDHGDYCDWPSEQAKINDVQNLVDAETRMGWHMLNNEHVNIAVNGDTLTLIGVDNVGDKPFKCYGDLQKAYPDIADSRHKILLSHSPSHWDDSIANNPDANIALTLSGHTHAGQAAIDHKMSPIALRYEHWGGLYTDSLGRHLYVNIGAGTVGMPMRIGATPEITVITLKRK